MTVNLARQENILNFIKTLLIQQYSEKLVAGASMCLIYRYDVGCTDFLVNKMQNTYTDFLLLTKEIIAEKRNNYFQNFIRNVLHIKSIECTGFAQT